MAPRKLATISTPKASVLGPLIDEFGELEQRLAAFKPVSDRRDELRKEILGWYENAGAGEKFTLAGSRFNVEVSACGQERSIISMPKLFKRLGQKLFFAVCKVSLKSVDEHIAAAEQAEFVTISQSGPRRLKASLRLQSSPPQAA